MYKCRHSRKTNKKALSVKTVSVIVSLALVLCTIIGGTIAWLIDTTDTVKNTFTYGDINIDLKETTGDTYKMMPGTDVAKDPKISVKADSENCWLFVKIEKSANFDAFMTYEIADGWDELKDENDQVVPGVYVRQVDQGDAAAAVGLSVLKGDKVTVLDTVTKGQLNALTQETLPTLSFTGYAVQRDDNFTTAISAWNAISAQANA